MATKTTSTTDNIAGCSPCTPEAHQRSVFENNINPDFLTSEEKHHEID